MPLTKLVILFLKGLISDTSSKVRT